MKSQPSLEQKWLEIIKPNSLSAIVGAPDSGKSVLALYVAEIIVKNRGGNIFMYGIPEENRDRYQGHVQFLDPMEDLSEAPNDGVLIIEEASQSFHSRTSMSKENLLLSRLKNIRRHKGLTIIVVVQRGTEVDKNLANSVDVLLIKKPEIFQPLSDRIQFRPHFQEAQRLFANPKINPKKWVYVSTLGRLERNRRPSYWTNAISTSLGPSRMEGRRPPYQMEKRERMLEAHVHKMEGKSSRESADILGRSHTTILSYLKNYPGAPQSRLPEAEFEALRREAEQEFARRNDKQTPEMLPEEDEEDWHPEEPEIAPEPVSLRETSVTGQCQTGHIFREEDGRIKFCTECGTQVIWGHTNPSLAEQYRSQKALLEKNFGKAGLDAKDGKLKELASVGAGFGVGIIPLFAIDIIDNAVDGTEWSEKRKSWVKWGTRATDLGLGITGTITNAPRILKGEGKWHNWLILGVAIEQIPISLYKMLELFRGPASPMPMEEPVQDWRENPMVKAMRERSGLQEEKTEEVPPPRDPTPAITATQKEEGQSEIGLSEEAPPEAETPMSNAQMNELLADIRECTSKVMDDPQLLSIWNDVLDIVVSDQYSDDEKSNYVQRAKALAV